MTIPCVFDGPDLDDVAALSGCSIEEVVAQLTAQPLTAAVMGFSPGFAYLEGLPAALARVPRRERPRPAVPAGSVALANGHAAVYPTASPGGWHLVGRTRYPLFSATEPPYAALALGDRIHFGVAAVGDSVVPTGSGPARLVAARGGPVRARGDVTGPARRPPRRRPARCRRSGSPGRGAG